MTTWTSNLFEQKNLTGKDSKRGMTSWGFCVAYPYMEICIQVHTAAKSSKVVPDKPKRPKSSAKSTMGVTNFNSGLCKIFHVKNSKDLRPRAMILIEIVGDLILRSLAMSTQQLLISLHRAVRFRCFKTKKINSSMQSY